MTKLATRAKQRIDVKDWNEGLEKGKKVVFRDIFPYKIIDTIQF